MALVACVGSLSCSSQSSSTPAAPTPPPGFGVPVASVALVGSPPKLGAPSQFTATANYADGRREDVSVRATWRVSDDRIASVSATGLVFALKPGDAEVIVTFGGQSARSPFHIERAFFTLTGTVRDSGSASALPNIRLEVVDGEDAGKSAVTDRDGAYTIGGLNFGTITLAASADGYQAATKRVPVLGDARADFSLDPAKPGRGFLSFTTTATKGYRYIEILIGGKVVGTLLRAAPDEPFSCFNAVPDERLVVPVSPGTVAFSARTNQGVTWSGTVEVDDLTCYYVPLGCRDGDCGGLAAQQPPSAARAPR